MKKFIVRELLLHASMFSFFVCTHVTSVFVPGSSDVYGGEAKFFTKWNLYLNIVYFAICCIVDFLCFCFMDPENAKKIRTHIFCSIVVPSNLITAFVFWGIYAIEPELMLPAWKRKFITVNSFQNQALHTAPLLTIFLEWAFVYHRPPRTLSVMLTWVMYATAYLLWIVWLGSYKNVWVHPFLQDMSNAGRALFFGVVFLFGCFLAKIGLSLLHAVWKDENSKKKTRNLEA